MMTALIFIVIAAQVLVGVVITGFSAMAWMLSGGSGDYLPSPNEIGCIAGMIFGVFLIFSGLVFAWRM